jgi:hypothetical protein
MDSLLLSSSMSPRKRRRSQALPETEGDRGTPNQHLVSDRLPTNDLDKERVVWDSFREEHFEGTSTFYPSFDLYRDHL